jgi:hypothetical protein
VADDVDRLWEGWIAGVKRTILDLVVSRLTAAARLDGTRLGESTCPSIMFFSDGAVTLLSGTARLGDLDTALSTRRDKAAREMERAWSTFEKGLR